MKQQQLPDFVSFWCIQSAIQRNRIKKNADVLDDTVFYKLIYATQYA